MDELTQSGVCALTGGPESISRAREYARRLILEADPAVPLVVEQDALLAVSEMVTNAVRHAPGACTLEIRIDERSIRVLVSDTSRSLPSPRTARFDGSGGFGLHLLRKIAGEVETVRRPNGKTVSVCLDRSPHPPDQPPR